MGTSWNQQFWIHSTLRLLTPPMETPDPPNDTPGALKQVVLTPHDIPWSLREEHHFKQGSIPTLMLPQGLNSWSGELNKGLFLVGAWQCLVSKNHSPHIQPYLPKRRYHLGSQTKKYSIYLNFRPKDTIKKVWLDVFGGFFFGMLVDLIHPMLGNKSRETPPPGSKGPSGGVSTGTKLKPLEWGGKCLLTSLFHLVRQICHLLFDVWWLKTWGFTWICGI